MSQLQLQEAIQFLKSGHRARAQALLIKILERDTRNDNAWVALSACLDTPGQKRSCLEKALAINPENPAARRALADLDREQVVSPRAVKVETQLLLDKASAAECNRRYSDAYAGYSQVLESDAACIPAWLGKGLAAGMLCTTDSIRVNEAVQCFRTALQLAQESAGGGQLAFVQKEIVDRDEAIVEHINRLSHGVHLEPRAASRLAHAGLFVLSHAYSCENEPASRSRIISQLRLQVHNILDSEKRAWEARKINLFDRPDLMQRLSQSVQLLVPEELSNEPSFRTMLDRFFEKPLPEKRQPKSQLPSGRDTAPNLFLRISRYLFFRLLVVAATLCVSVYIAILVANLGGYVDRIAEADIDGAIQGMAMGGYFRDIPEEDADRVIVELRYEMMVARGLFQPFLIRNARWTVEALTYRWKDPAVLETLPYTVLLFGVAAVIIFIASLAVSLGLSLRYGSLLDRVMVALSPLSSAPSWVHGLLLVVVFAILLDWFPISGIYDAEIPEDQLGYILMIARHMVLPVAAIFMSIFFQLVYTWRTFFLIHSGEDYVDVALAKGLPSRMIEQRYILRPTLPFIITNYSLMVLGFWQSAIALEMFFDWPGLGQLYMSAIQMRGYQPGLVMSLVTVFAYLLAISFFLLEVIYVLVDPRVSLVNGTQASESGPKVLKIELRLPDLSLAWERFMETSLTILRLKPSISFSSAGLKDSIRRAAGGFRRSMRELMRYPSAVVGLAVIGVMLAISLGALIALPYEDVVSYWNRIDVVDQPRFAMPTWVNFFRKDKLPETIVQDSQKGEVDKQVQDLGQGVKQITFTYNIDYPYDGFPQDLSLHVFAHYKEKRPHLTLKWIQPGGEEFQVATFSSTPVITYIFSQDEKLQRKLKTKFPQQALFAGPGFSDAKAQRGQYTLVVNVLLFEEDADLDARLVLYGQVFGLAGTDHRRRDLLPALIWGAPAGLGIGFVGAVLTSLAAMLLAAVGAWFGGPVDGLIQRISEVNLTLPMLPIGIMVYYMYSKNIWVILLAIVVFTMLGSPIKNYRAAFLQVKQAPYIEAALAYGAGNWRVIKNYLVPRIIPVLVPQLVATIPGFIFLEATLAILGVSDLYLPTWGKVIYDALTKGAFQGYYYWILEPLALLLIAGMSFALVGFALDRIFNPRLRAL